MFNRERYRRSRFVVGKQARGGDQGSRECGNSRSRAVQCPDREPVCILFAIAYYIRAGKHAPRSRRKIRKLRKLHLLRVNQLLP